MKIETVRHSLAHLMASVVQELYPTVKFGIGPAIKNGFYYDFDFQELKITNQDLIKIQAKMKDLIKKNIKFKKKIISKSEAQIIFKNQPYKLEIINEMVNEQISIYQSGNFIDLCVGPHVKTTTEIPSEAFILTKIAGAYWKGSEKNPMLTRIYGLSFTTKEEMNNFLEEENKAKERDHRKLNDILNFYQISDQVGPGLVIWHPKGAIVRNIIEDFWKKEHTKRGYNYVFSPHIGKIDLWEKSGHTKFYRENMYSTMKADEVEYQIKPMNCPFHVLIYSSEIRSYKTLPIRLCELGTVYRYEKIGVLHGLLRVRGFTQDDAHIFCRFSQLNEEILKIIDLTFFMLNSFGFKDFDIDLSLRSPSKQSKYLGNNLMWKKAEQALTNALNQKKLNYQTALGEAVFYGPKIDIKLKDSLGRLWQGPTIQVDFNFPEKFNLSCINENGQKESIAMIHRTVLGTMERFMGNLMEHYGGNFPLWLSPEQIWILPVTSSHNQYAQQVAKQLKKHNFRIKTIDENETLSKKIRAGEIQKIPYLLVVGDREKEENSVSVRKKEQGDLGSIKINQFIKDITLEIKNKK